MSAFETFSTTAASNTSVGGVSIAENCPAANINDAIRYILKEGKELNTLVAAISTSTLMPKSGGAFTGTIARNGAGGYWYHASSSQATGPVYTQAVATALPSSPAEGTVVLRY